MMEQVSFMKYIFLLSVIILAGCAALSPSGSNSSYSEDLSVYRPTVEAGTTEEVTVEEKTPDVTPTHHQTVEIDRKIDVISSHNRRNGSAQGFTIQVYSGTSREQASQAKAQVYKILPDSRPETKYEQPIYRVRVGEFMDRLDAQNTYAELLPEFPQAIVIPTRIRLN